MFLGMKGKSGQRLGEAYRRPFTSGRLFNGIYSAPRLEYKCLMAIIRSRRPVICHPITRPKLDQKTSVFHYSGSYWRWCVWDQKQWRTVEVSDPGVREGAKARRTNARSGERKGAGSCGEQARRRSCLPMVCHPSKGRPPVRAWQHSHEGPEGCSHGAVRVWARD